MTTVEEAGPATSVRQRIWDWAVHLVVAFMVAVMSHPSVQAVMSQVIVSAMNAFLEQPDIGERLDTTARSLLYDDARRKQAAREVGQDVLPLMTNFMGGVMSSVVSRPKRQKSNATSTSSLPPNDRSNSSSRSSSSFLKAKDT
jgi:predicted transcriptional regulator